VFPWAEYCSTLLGYLLMIVLSSCLYYVGSEPLYKQDMSELWITPLWVLIWSQQIMFAHLTFNTDVCSTTAMRYSPWNNRFCVVTILYSLVVCVINMFTENQMFKVYTIYILFGIAVVSKGHYAYNITMEMCETLDIKIFKVKQRDQPFVGDADLNATLQKK
jgi:uncharacterized membrane protein